jgi:putative membrane protein
MDIWFNLLLLVHLLALVVAGATAVVMPIIGGRMATATPEMRGNLAAIGNRLGLNARVALGALLISGPLMLWLRYGGIDGASVWFWVKMALVAVMLAAVIVSGVNARRVQAGDRQAAALQRQVGTVSRFAFLGVIIAAVLAFN